MKLKPLVVASMSVLSMSLISYPIFAADTATTTTETTQTETQTTNTETPAKPQKTIKHKYHKKTAMVQSHQHVVKEEIASVQTVPVVSTVPMVDSYAITLDAMTQNLGRQVRPTADWFNRIGVIGGINSDFHWGNLHMGYQGENSRRISLNDAYLNVSAIVNDWAKAFISASFNNTTGLNTNNEEVVSQTRPGIYSSAYTNNELSLEQGYLTLGNLNCSPFFVQFGKQFQDFGRYQIHPIERTMAQVLSESLATSAKLGFLTPVGLHGSVFVFDDNLRKVTYSKTSPVWGGALGWDMPSDELGWDLGVAYMSSMSGVNDVNYGIRTFELNAPGASPFGTFQGTVGAWSAYADVNSGPFGLSGRYTTAAHKYSADTLSTFLFDTTASGARPWAADIAAGYGFNAWCKNQNVYVGYQASGNAVNLFLPKQRWIAGYGIDVWKNTTLSAEYGHDKDYSSSSGGTGRASNTLGARAAVRFG